MLVRSAQSDSVKPKMTGRHIMEVLICLVLMFLMGGCGPGRRVIEQRGEGYNILKTWEYTGVRGGKCGRCGAAVWDVSMCGECGAFFKNYYRETIVDVKVEITTNDQTVIERLAQEPRIGFPYSVELRRAAMEKLTNKELLEEIAKKDSDWDVQAAAVELLTNQEVLEEIAKKDSTGWVRLAAVLKLTNQEVLEEIAKKDSSRRVRWHAIKKLTNQEVLEEIAKKDSDEDVREAAMERLKHLRK